MLIDEARPSTTPSTALDRQGEADRGEDHIEE